MSSDEISRADIARQVLAGALSAKLQSLNGQQQRAATLLAVNGVALGVLATLEPTMPSWAKLPLALALALTVLAMVFGALAVRTKSLPQDLPPPRSDLAETATIPQFADYTSGKPEDLSLSIARFSYDTLIGPAKKVEEDRGKWMRREFWVLVVVGVILLLVTAVNILVPSDSAFLPTCN